MTKALLITIAVLCFAGCKGNKKNNPSATLFKVTTFKSEAGWGYAVIIKGKPFIRQPYIPAVSGNIPFKSEEDALKVGKYVCTLIQTRHLPSVRSADLVKMGILSDTCLTKRPQDQIH